MIELEPKAWRTLAAKFKIKDNGLEKALTSYEKLAEDAHDDCLKTITTVTQLAGTLKKTKEIAAAPPLGKYLGELLAAAETEKNEVTRLKAAAAKAVAEKAKAAAAQLDKTRAPGKEEELEAEEGDYKTKLLAAFQKVKGAKDQVFEYVICEAKPHCGLMMARKIGAAHKQELTQVTGGGKRFLPVGTVEFREGHFVFNTDTPVAGLARRLQDSIKNFTGRKFPIRIGAEAAGAEETEGGAGEAGASAAGAESATIGSAGPARPIPELLRGTEAWVVTCNTLLADVRTLGKAIQNACANEPAEFTKEVNKNLARLEELVARLGRRLAESLAKASEAPDSAARQSELARSKAIMAETVRDVKPLAALIDGNPFMKTNFTAALTGGLTNAAQAITRGLAAA